MSNPLRNAQLVGSYVKSVTDCPLRIQVQGAAVAPSELRLALDGLSTDGLIEPIDLDGASVLPAEDISALVRRIAESGLHALEKGCLERAH